MYSKLPKTNLHSLHRHVCQSTDKNARIVPTTVNKTGSWQALPNLETHSYFLFKSDSIKEHCSSFGRTSSCTRYTFYTVASPSKGSRAVEKKNGAQYASSTVTIFNPIKKRNERGRTVTLRALPCVYFTRNEVNVHTLVITLLLLLLLLLIITQRQLKLYGYV